MLMFLNSNFQYCKIELDRIVIRWIKKKISDFAIVLTYDLFNTKITMNADVIHDDNVSKSKIDVATKQ